MFSKAGDVLRVIMGLDKQQRTPCGFAFGEERRRTLPCVCVSLGGVERGKGGGRGGEEEGREGEKLTFFDTKKTFFLNLGSGLLRPLRRRGRRQVPQRGRARREADPSRLRLGFRRGEAVRAVRPSERKKSEFIFFGGGGFFRSSWTPFLAHLCLPSSLLPSPSLPPSLSFPLKKKIAGDPAARSGTSTGTATIRAGAGGARWCARRSSSSSSRRPAAAEEEGETTTASGCEFRFFVFG